MNAQDRVALRMGRLVPGQRLERLGLERPHDGAQPVRTFGMSPAHVVVQPDRMRQKQCGHDRESPASRDDRLLHEGNSWEGFNSKPTRASKIMVSR